MYVVCEIGITRDSDAFLRFAPQKDNTFKRF